MSRARHPILFAAMLLLATAGAAAAASDDYPLARSTGTVDFTIHAGVIFKTAHEGRFKDFTGTLSYDPSRPSETQVNLTVFTASVDMNDADNDETLRSPDFFDVDRFPTMRFASRGTNVGPDGTLALIGDLTIRDVTKRVALPVKIAHTSQGAGTPTQFETTFQIDRTEFGLTGTPKRAGLNISIGKNVQIHIVLAAGRPITR